MDPAPVTRASATPASTWARRGAAAAVLLALLTAISVVIRPVPGHALDLSGAWPAAVDGAARVVDLPGVWALQGLPAEGRVVLRRSVTVAEASNAVYLEQPLYAVAVAWDGVPVGGTGDPAVDAPAARSARSLFLPLPAVAPGSTHELSLDVRGAYGKGGVTGRMLLGPTEAVRDVARSVELQRLALVVGLAMLGALPLIVSLRGAWRPTYLAYGAFVAAVALLLLAMTDLATVWLPDPSGPLRLRRLMDPLVAVFGVCYAEAYVQGRLGRAAMVFCGVGAALSLLGGGVPGPWLYRLEVAGDTLVLIGGVWFGARVYEAWRTGLAGSHILVFALSAVLWAALSEITVTHGLRAGGSHIPLAALLFSLALGAAVVIRDAALSDQHEHLVRSTLDAMVVIDARGRIGEANPAAVHLLGASGRLLPGTSFLSGVAEADQPVVRAHLGRAATHADRCEFRSREARVLESLATPLGHGVSILTLRDITRRREIDRAVLHAARIETAGLLLGGIAHDFNNMLSSLLAHVGLVRMQVTEPKLRERLDKMETTVERASELTRRLLTVARGTGSELEPVDLTVVCRTAADLAEPTFPAEVKLSFDLPSDLPPVLGAAGDLEQVVLNLLVNARDAVGDRGAVRLCARPFSLDARLTGVVVMVEDTGKGVAPARREEIFEPFVTDKAHGTGLGLAVARQILRDHHGRIWVEDRPGGGARFFLALRHVDAVDEAPATLPARRRILVVEDEQVLLEAHLAALKEAGYEPVGLQSSTEAAHWLQTEAPDLLLTDVRMPGFHGIELARLCRQLHPRTPILFVTAFVPDPSVHEFAEGTWSALHKPVRLARLVATVGHLRRRAERAESGAEDVTAVSYAFPALDRLSGRALGF